MLRLINGLVGFGLILGLAGCSPAVVKPTLEKVVPVSGTVTYQGKPVESFQVSFIPTDGRRAAVGITDASGKFTLGTNDVADGCASRKAQSFDRLRAHVDGRFRIRVAGGRSEIAPQAQTCCSQQVRKPGDFRTRARGSRWRPDRLKNRTEVIRPKMQFRAVQFFSLVRQ